MKGIILAGGSGSRLYPLTMATSKQLLPVYNKPLIYYPLTTLMLAGIQDILIITTPEDQPGFQRLLKDGSQWGISLSYAVQPTPGGTVQAILIGEHFIDHGTVGLILGDNIFYGEGMPGILKDSSRLTTGGLILAYYVQHPERYGVVTFNDEEQVIDIEEKPEHPRSNWAMTGLFFYSKDVVEIAKTVRPSPRGELEITDVNKHYMRQGALKLRLLGRGNAWFDTGTHESLLEAANYVAAVERRQGLMIACPEEIAYSMGYIDAEQMQRLTENYRKNSYGSYLQRQLLTKKL
ncbi:MAG: glucose-1-phosphate thymidylyltransferase RfbA [Magnetococcales bacterium]|nr:glucose-1-phosphate thymidylyltransferase RfbA [Magnetococcales bacterium]MBF0439816.1 glucose-1-phosphate thymidylyltransferase RfbA [Magnetococcales bacterium]